MDGEWVKIAAPATSANIGAGFDTFGIAFEGPCDIIEGRRTESGIRIVEVSGPGSCSIPLDPDKNSVSIAAKEVLKMAGEDFGIDIRITKGIRPCSGMGSSGASASGGAYLAHVLTGEKLSMNDVIIAAATAEGVTSGGFHADNVAPCILGGFTIIRSNKPLDVMSVKPPANLGIVAALPDVLVPTKDARAVLPKEVALKDMVFHIGHASSLVYAMMAGDIDLIGRSIADAVIEPARTKLVPHIREAEEAAKANGAISSCIGGSGPCILSLFNKDKTDGKAIAAAVEKVYSESGMKCDTWITNCGLGCRRI
ncbi:homoserine kinase ThrB [methanogenic archaeon mixed culture ISO4-G1]|nr:homoserine kinase ThrB [methanogenic archaeon mixed culture ISO4-G1]